ncbi:hypothetical protein RSSM_01947 [Rhodopirellula sallentina SM41]|uniref:Uncharacterized protein n=1 Tax=Rhodopirellula sallentina SM41 TaxID=1263870 RepID=M5U5R2_9BACT|nr:hypothetical protein RSSM_01947 [Rhodopirellula sallentina SM41]
MNLTSGDGSLFFPTRNREVVASFIAPAGSQLWFSSETLMKTF